MRYDVDLLSKKEQITINDPAKISDRINDPYLANRIGSYKDISYELLIQNLYKNPLLYNQKVSDVKIEYLDDFCLKYQNKPLSLGGLVLNKDIKKSKKKKIIKKYFDKNIEEYNRDLNDKILQMDHILNLSDSFNPRKIKFWTFIVTLLITLIVYLINFPNEYLLNFIGPHLNIMLNKASTYNLFNMFRYISFVSCLLTTLYILFYFICTFILSRKFDNTFDAVEELSAKVKKQTKKAFRKVVKHYLKQVKVKDISKYKTYSTSKIIDKKYQLNNIDILNKKSVTRLSKIKNTINYLFNLRILLYILMIISLAIYIVLLFI